jgi:hypothetical protein
MLSGGCSLVLPFSDPAADGVVTGSIAPRTPPRPERLPHQVLSPELNTEDWRRAEGALAIALEPQGNGTAAPWDNPETGRKGSFAPVGDAFLEADVICRAFLARLSLPAGSSEHQGTACRTAPGQWAVKQAKPFARPS